MEFSTRRECSFHHSDAPLASTRSLVRRKVVRVRSVGKQRMCDLEVAHPKHNFLLPNGVVTSNSHAVCYVVIGYACAYLKHHYPLEWWCAVLRHAKKEELNTKFWKHCGNLIALPSLARSNGTFTIAGDKIQAPLTLLEGVGEVVLKEVTSYQPIASIEEFCQKIEDRRVREGTMVTKTTETMTKKGLKTKTTTKLKKARTAVNNGLISKMIVCGIADELFPSGMTLLDKLQHFYKVHCTIGGKINKKTLLPKLAVPAKFRNLSAMELYQVQKELLPAFAGDLLTLVYEASDKLTNHDDKYLSYRHKSRDYIIVSSAGLDSIENLSPWPPGQKHTVAVVAYVLNYERKRSSKDNRERAEVTLDIAGNHRQYMLWCDRDAKDLDSHLQQNLKGSIAVVLLEKYKEDRPFSVKDIAVIQPPSSDILEEESPESGDEE